MNLTLFCSVSVISANKLLLQEFIQLIRIKLLISRFQQIFASHFQFPGEANACFAPLRTPMNSDAQRLPFLRLKAKIETTTVVFSSLLSSAFLFVYIRGRESFGLREP